MTRKPKEKQKKASILLVIIFFIYSDILCENFLVIVNDKQPHLYSVILLFTLLILQIIFAPLQSGFSDFYGRKKSLLISLFLSLISVFLAFYYLNNIIIFASVIFLSNLIKGVWGNTIPISFAAIADTQRGGYRESFALASGVYAIAFITFIALNHFSFSKNVMGYAVGGILLLSILICLAIFKDSEDKTAHLPFNKGYQTQQGIINRIFTISRKEIILIKKELSRSLTRRASFSYLLWETSMYSILVSEVDFYRVKGRNFVLYMMLGYLFGIVFLRLKNIRKLKDCTILKIGYLTSFLSLFPYFFFYPSLGDNALVLGVCYFFHALGNALLSPTIITILAKERSSHDQGKILGIVESFDTISFLISTVIVMLMVYLKIPIFFLILFSFVSFSISWIFYRRLIDDSKKLINKNL